MSRLWIAALGLALGVGACIPAEDDRVQWSDDFESGELTGWTGGPATVVTTNHPGEHAAQLESGAVIRHALGITTMYESDPYGYYDDGSFTDGNWIEYSTDCTGRPTLEMVATAATTLDVRLTLAGPGGVAFERRHLTFPRLPTRDVVGSDMFTATFTALYIGTSGRCRIDNLRVMVSGGTIGY